MNVYPVFEQVQDGRGQRGTVAFDGDLEFQPFPLCHDGDAVTSDITAQQDRIAALNLLRSNPSSVLNPTDARGVDKHPIPFPLVDDLGISGHQ